MRNAVQIALGIILTIMCWGAYGPVLHKGQMNMNSERLKPLICVGVAYFLIAIVIPMLILAPSGKISGSWTPMGVLWSLAGGTAGAVGALGIIWAISSGAGPDFVMPLVFGFAPIVNVMVGMYLRGAKWTDMGTGFPFFLAGVIMVGVGASMILIFAPKGHPAKKPAAAATSSVHAPSPPMASPEKSDVSGGKPTT